MKKIKKIKTDTETNIIINNMTDFEQARWFALIDAVNIVANMCEEKKVAFDSIDIKPSAIEKYIESTCDIYAKKIDDQKQKAALGVVSKIVTNFEVLQCQKI